MTVNDAVTAADALHGTSLLELLPPRLVAPEHLEILFSDLPEPRCAVGETAALRISGEERSPRAAHLLRRAAELFSCGAGDDPFSLHPFYLAEPGVTLRPR